MTEACPKCRRKMGGFTEEPDPGDLIICGSCLVLLRMSDNCVLELVDMTTLSDTDLELVEKCRRRSAMDAPS